MELRSSGERSAFSILVWSCIDSYRYRHASTDKTDRMIRDAYEIARERVMRGEKLPKLPVATLAGHGSDATPESRRRDPEVARNAFGELDELFRSAGAQVSEGVAAAEVTP